ncbi:MAG: hypothetical protein AAF724_23380 [Pseudomonadota bacterium]
MAALKRSFYALNRDQRLGLIAVFALAEFISIMIGCGIGSCFGSDDVLRLQGAGFGAAAGFAVAAVAIAFVIRCVADDLAIDPNPTRESEVHHATE